MRPNGYRQAHLLLVLCGGESWFCNILTPASRCYWFGGTQTPGSLADVCGSCRYTIQFCAGDLAFALVLVLVNPAILTGISEEASPQAPP